MNDTSQNFHYSRNGSGDGNESNNKNGIGIEVKTYHENGNSNSYLSGIKSPGSLSKRTSYDENQNMKTNSNIFIDMSGDMTLYEKKNVPLIPPAVLTAVERLEKKFLKKNENDYLCKDDNNLKEDFDTNILPDIGGLLQGFIEIIIEKQYSDFFFKNKLSSQ